MTRLALVLVLAVAALVAGGAAARRTLPPPGIRGNAGWLTATTGPTSASRLPYVVAVTASSSPDALVPSDPFAGLTKLDATGALIVASTLRRGGYANPFAPAAWPPRLSQFRVDHAWETQPESRIEQRLLGLTTGGWSIDVRVYFGSQHPSARLLAAVRAELRRLTRPA